MVAQGPNTSGRIGEKHLRVPPLWSGGRDSFGLGIDCFPGSSVLGTTLSILNSVDRSSFGISNYLEDEDSISRWLPVWLGGLLTQSYTYTYIYIGLYRVELCRPETLEATAPAI